MVEKKGKECKNVDITSLPDREVHERHERLCNAAVGQARANNAAMVSALGDAAIGTRSSSCNCLPDDTAVVADTKLGRAIAYNGAVLAAGA